MRDYGKVHTKFWSSDDIRGLTDDGRLLALYVMTSPHSTIAGVFHLPDGYVCEDMQWTRERVDEGFDELLAKGFGNRCGTTKWVWITKHLDWNPPENPNQRKSAAKVARSVPDKCSWKAEFMRVCGPSLGIEPLAPLNPSPTVQKHLANQEQEQKQEQQQDQEHSAKAGGAAAKAKTPEELAKAELWRAAVSLFTGQGMPEPQSRQFFGKLAKDYPDGATVTDALRNCIAEQPADARAWLTSECQRLAGTRKPRRPTSHNGLADKDYHQGVTADGTLA
jgi:hypothetical protein